MLGSQPSLTAKTYFRISAEEEDRDRDPDQRADEAHVVEDAAVALRGEEAERDAEEDREEHRRERELDRGREALLELVRDRAAAS